MRIIYSHHHVRHASLDTLSTVKGPSTITADVVRIKKNYILPFSVINESHKNVINLIFIDPGINFEKSGQIKICSNISNYKTKKEYQLYHELCERSFNFTDQL
jgi:hypothetical protein